MRTGIKNKLALGLAALLLVAPVAMQARVGPGSLEDHVRNALAKVPYLGVFDDLSFRVDGGTVTLFGEVTQPYKKVDAEDAVKGLEGVTRVNNQIEVLPVSLFDDQIRAATFRAIYSFPALQRYVMGGVPMIHIIVKNGDVRLAGYVSTTGDRNMAYIRANSVPGVFSVTNDLQVSDR